MNISFCINTFSGHGKDCSIFIPTIIKSIEEQNIPNYEVLIIGDYREKHKNTKTIYFDDIKNPGWISKKKNILAQISQYETLTYLHDYIYLLPNWFKGWLKFGNNFDVGMNVIINSDNSRFRDWIAFDDLENHGDRFFQHRNFPTDNPIITSPHLPEYIYSNTNKMYISGSFFVVKRKIILENPFNETMIWGSPEDIFWSMQIRNKCNIKMNTFSAVKLLKYKDSVWKSNNPYFMTNEYITKGLV